MMPDAQAFLDHVEAEHRAELARLRAELEAPPPPDRYKIGSVVGGVYLCSDEEAGIPRRAGWPIELQDNPMAAADWLRSLWEGGS